MKWGKKGNLFPGLSFYREFDDNREWVRYFFVVVGFFFSLILFHSVGCSDQQKFPQNRSKWYCEISRNECSHIPFYHRQQITKIWAGMRGWGLLYDVYFPVCVCVRCYPFPISPLGWCFRCWTECMDRKNRIKNSCRSCERFNYEHPFGGLMFLISRPNCKIKKLLK